MTLASLRAGTISDTNGRSLASPVGSPAPLRASSVTRRSTRLPRQASQATYVIERAMPNWSARAAGGTVIVTQATMTDASRKAAAKSLTAIGGRRASAPPTVRRLRPLRRAAREAGRWRGRDGRDRLSGRLVVLVEAGARVPAP